MNRRPITVLVSTLLATFLLVTLISINAVETALTHRLRNSDREVAHAIAIGLSRSHIGLDDAQALIDAHFALGTYQRIRLLDAQGRALYVRERQPIGSDSDTADNRLFWLWTLKPREQLPSATAPIRADWLNNGNVSVQSVLSFDHHASETWMLRLAGLLTLLGAIATGTLLLQTKRQKQGLEQLQDALERLSTNEAVSVGSTAHAEFAGLSRAVEHLSEQLAGRSSQALEHVEQLNRLRRSDIATGLLNRDAFRGRLQQACDELPPQQQAMLLLVRLLNLQELNLSHGRQQVDAWLAQLGRQLLHWADGNGGAGCARITGTDVAVLISPASNSKQTLAEDVANAIVNSDLQTRIDFIHFSRDEHPDDIFRRCELNLDISQQPVLQQLDQRQAWYDRLTWALVQHHFFLKGFRVNDRNGHLIHREFFLRLPDRSAGHVYNGGTLIAWAEHLGLAGEIDLAVVNLALTSAAEHEERVCINLSGAALLDTERRAALVRDLGQSPRYAGQVDIEIEERAAFANLDVVTTFARALAPMGIRVGIDHLDEHAGGLMRLQGSGIQYVKVAKPLTSDLLDAARGRECARLLTEMLHSSRTLSLQIYAEGVTTTTLANALFDIGFDGITGPAVGE